MTIFLEDDTAMFDENGAPLLLDEPVPYASPTRVATVNTDYTSGTTKTSPAVTVEAGDLIVMILSCENSNGFAVPNDPTSGSSAISWTFQGNYFGGQFQAAMAVWTGVANITGSTSAKIILTNPNALVWGFTLSQWRGYSSYSTVTLANSATANSFPSMTRTTTQRGVLLSAFIDWNIGTGTRLWRTINVAPMTEEFYLVGSRSTIYQGYAPDALPGSNVTGLESPTMRWVGMTLEIRGP